MNKVFLLGRLTRDVEVKFSRDTAFARVSIAVDRRFSKEKITDFFNLVAFGKNAYFADGANKKPPTLMTRSAARSLMTAIIRFDPLPPCKSLL